MTATQSDSAHRQRSQCAADLYHAEMTQTVIPQLTKTHPDMVLDDAYAIQRMWAKLHTAQGARVIGHKIGLTSRAMQMASNFNEPDFGHLLDSMLFIFAGLVVVSLLIVVPLTLLNMRAICQPVEQACALFIRAVHFHL